MVGHPSAAGNLIFPHRTVQFAGSSRANVQTYTICIGVWLCGCGDQKLKSFCNINFLLNTSVKQFDFVKNTMLSFNILQCTKNTWLHHNEYNPSIFFNLLQLQIVLQDRLNTLNSSNLSTLNSSLPRRTSGCEVNRNRTLCRLHCCCLIREARRNIDVQPIVMEVTDCFLHTDVCWLLARGFQLRNCHRSLPSLPL